MSSIKDFELAQRVFIATHELKTRIAELEAERDALAKDAARYRWLRDNASPQWRNGPGLYWYLPRWMPAGECKLDAAIDAAIDATKEKP